VVHKFARLVSIRARTAVSVVVTLALTLATLGALAGPAAATPSAWDHRILPLVKFVQKARKLEFTHPIPVEFLSDAAFKKRVRHDDAKVTASDRRDAKRYVAELRALGLLQGNVDLIAAEKNLSGVDTLGYYDQDAKKMVIRGKNLADVATRVTVVHELTHALQDQHFDLNKLTDATKTSGADTALTALIEGDAVRVENKYVDALSKADQNAYDKTLNSEQDAATPGVAGTDLADVPPILSLFDEAPYDFGTPFVDTLVDKNGVKAIDGAFRHPPTSEQQIIDPVTYFSDLAPLHVAVPKLSAGEKRQGAPDDFGALSLFIMLVSRRGFATSLAAAEAWGGDRFVSFTRGNETCVRMAVRGRSPNGTRTISDALTAWAGAGPAGGATVATNGSVVTVTACDVGGGGSPSFDTLMNAVNTLTGRAEVIGQVIGAGAPPPTATCIADKFVNDPTLAPLLQKDTITKAEQDLVTQGFKGFVSACAGS
jgi:hypothetical protein